MPLTVTGQTGAHFDAKAVDFFEKKVRPVLVSNCYTCHSASTNSKGGLRVDDRNGLIVGGNGGSAVVPGHPEDSLLIKAVAQSDQDLKMPPKKRLSAQQVADLTRWIKDGAAWPEVGQAAPASYMLSTKYEELRKEHWSWQPLKETRPPIVHDLRRRRRPWSRLAPSSRRCATNPRGAHPAPAAGRNARLPGRTSTSSRTSSRS